MSSNTTSGDHGINGNLNVSNSLTSSGLTISSGNVNFTGATFTSNCIPSTAVSGGGGGGSSSTATTQPNGDNSTNIATTAFVQNSLYPITDITYTPYTNNIYTSVGHNFSIGGNLSIPINSGAFIYTYDGSNYQSTAFNLIPKLSFLSDMSGSTIQTQLNNLSSSLSNYLTTSNANSTYAPISSLSNYLTTATASSTYAPISSLSSYLTTATASSTYAPISSLSSYLTTATAASTYVSKTNGFTNAPTSYSPAPSSTQIGYSFFGTNYFGTHPSSNGLSSSGGNGGSQWVIQSSISIPQGVWFLQFSITIAPGSSGSTIIWGSAISSNASLSAPDPLCSNNGVQIGTLNNITLNITNVVTNATASNVTYYGYSYGNTTIKSTGTTPYVGNIFFQAIRIA